MLHRFMWVAGVAALAAPAFAQSPPPTLQPPAPPAPPASAAAVDAVATVKTVCLPVLEGRDLKASARAAGYRLDNGQWVLPIAGKRQIDLSPPDVANPHVCSATIDARPDAGAAMQRALGEWASQQSPPLTPVETNVSRDVSGATWTTSSWSGRTASGVERLVLTQEPKPAGGGETMSESELLVSLSPS